MRSLYNHITLSVFLALLFADNVVEAQTVVFPNDVIKKVRYNMQIDINSAYISGVCVLVKEDSEIQACVVNEFGLSLMDFVYDQKRNKVKLCHVMKSLDKWYIKRTLKNDLKSVMQAMAMGENEYLNKKRKLKYSFSILSYEPDVQTINEENDAD